MLGAQLLLRTARRQLIPNHSSVRPHGLIFRSAAGPTSAGHPPPPDALDLPLRCSAMRFRFALTGLIVLIGRTRRPRTGLGCRGGHRACRYPGRLAGGPGTDRPRACDEHRPGHPAGREYLSGHRAGQGRSHRHRQHGAVAQRRGNPADWRGLRGSINWSSRSIQSVRGCCLTRRAPDPASANDAQPHHPA